MQKQPSCSAGLLELTKKLEDEEPTIPDELIRYLLRTVGVNVQQKEGLRLVAAATEHFMGGVMNDAYLLRKQKHRQTQKNLKQLGMSMSGPAVLGTEDITDVLADAGVHLKTQMYYANKKSE
jgi:histone H3/H4